MEHKKLENLLEQFKNGGIQLPEILAQLRKMPFDDLGFAKVDHHRSLRTGHPEVIFCQNKTADQIVAIVENQIAHDETVFGTRASEEILSRVEGEFDKVECCRLSRCFWRKSSHWEQKKEVRGDIVIVAAGTSDSPVTEEARRTVEIFGHPCRVIQDVGVAGIHRLLAHSEILQGASVIITVAGMEGALPSVVCGMVSCPVIGVPTSVGYGAHLGGLVPMFAMLNSCASGLTVVNIDSGFGGAVAAVRMNKA